MTQKRTTTRDIAQASGYSNCTVSKALRGHTQIPEKTRDKILKVARELGYHPDPEIRKFMSYMSQKRGDPARSALALLTPYASKEESHRYDYYRYFKETVVKQAEIHGYSVDIFYMKDSDMRPARIRQIIDTRSIDGLLISPLGHNVGPMPVEFENLPIVSCTQTYDSPPMNRVQPDYYKNTNHAMNAVYKAGYRQPLMVLDGGFCDIDNGISEAVYHKFGASHYKKMLPNVVIIKDYDYSDLADIIEKTGADCIIANSIMSLNWMVLNGYTFDDLGFACLTLIPEAGNMQLEFTIDMKDIAGVDIHAKNIDQTAVDTLLGMILRNEKGVPKHPHIIATEGSWQNGITLPKAKHSALSLC